MINKLSLKEYRDHLASTSNIMSKSIAVALMRLGQETELDAKRNIKANFGNRNNYTLSGALFNSVYNRYTKGKTTQSMFIGSQGVPYSRIHEQAENGVSTKVVPKNAKFLWVRTREINAKGGLYRRLQPSQFYLGAKNKPEQTGFYYGKDKKGNLWAMVNSIRMTKSNKAIGETIPLFSLRKSVNIPQRPYLWPAMLKAKKLYPSYYRNALMQFLLKG